MSGKHTAKSDFYHWVNDHWLSDPSVVIPPEYPRYGSFIKLVDEALHNQINLLKELLGKKDGLTEDERKLMLVWKASMKRFEDWDKGKGSLDLVYEGLDNLDQHLGKEDGDYVSALGKYFSYCQKFGLKYPFVFGKESNLKESGNLVLDLGPSGLSLPSREHYLNQERFKQQLGWFRDHLKNIVNIVGEDRLEADFVERVVRFESKLASIYMKPDQQRRYDEYFTISTLDDLIDKLNELKHFSGKDNNYTENKGLGDDDDDVLCTEAFEVGESELEDIRTLLNCMYDHLDFREVMESNFKTNYPEKDAAEAQFRAMVFDGDYFRRLFRILLRPSNRTDLRAYLQYRVVLSTKEFATKDLNEEVFDFYQRKLHGTKEQKSHEKRSINFINSSSLGELMGKVYVKHFFSEDDKKIVKEMVEGILDIMGNSIKNNDWLTPATKEKAFLKLESIKIKLGYPDKWKNFDSLTLSDKDSLYDIDRQITMFEHETEFLEKLNTRKDPTKWEMNPQTVNAYYHPLMNEIVFPAAILQPPFYVKKIDDVDFPLTNEMKAMDGWEQKVITAINHGGIGAVIAHEITHGFDDQGRKFSHEGNIEEWWTPEDSKLFQTKCTVMGDQAGSWTYEEKSDPPKVHKLNAELCMGENLADLGGLSLSKQALVKHYADVPGSERKTILDVFFRSWANIWKSKQTEEFLINQIATDPHAPTHFRGNLLANLEEFYDVYQVQKDDPMYIPPEQRVKMW